MAPRLWSYSGCQPSMVVSEILLLSMTVGHALALQPLQPHVQESRKAFPTLPDGAIESLQEVITAHQQSDPLIRSSVLPNGAIEALPDTNLQQPQDKFGIQEVQAHRQSHPLIRSSVLPNGAIEALPDTNLQQPQGDFGNVQVAKDSLVQSSSGSWQHRKQFDLQGGSRPSLGLLAPSSWSLPAVASFKDSACSQQLGRWILPSEAALHDRACLTVQHENPTLDAANKQLSMTFECASGADSLGVILHFGSFCSGGDDDSMKLSVNGKNFTSLKAGNCVAANSYASHQTEYIKMLNVNSIQQWPSCMSSNAELVVVTFVLFATAIVGCLGCAWAYWQYKESQGKQKKYEEDEFGDVVLWRKGLSEEIAVKD